jgi:hypothetical protein
MRWLATSAGTTHRRWTATVDRMMRASKVRMTGSGLAVAMLMLLAPASFGLAAEVEGDHAVVGRFSITSEAGGAVWAFQPGGLLVLTGPGEISSRGTWSAAPGERDFDASVDYDIAGQSLVIQGQVAPDGAAIAVHVRASAASKPGDAEPWPSESRLLGERFGMTAEATPAPSQRPVDCSRPRWVDGEVDWDRCDDLPAGASPSASPAGRPEPSDA